MVNIWLIYGEYTVNVWWIYGEYMVNIWWMIVVEWVSIAMWVPQLLDGSYLENAIKLDDLRVPLF